MDVEFRKQKVKDKRKCVKPVSLLIGTTLAAFRKGRAKGGTTYKYQRM